MPWDDVICHRVSTSLKVALQCLLHSAHFGPATWVSPDYTAPSDSLSHGKTEVVSETEIAIRDGRTCLDNRL